MSSLFRSLIPCGRHHRPCLGSSWGISFICSPMAQRQAKAFRIDLEEVVVRLFVHGLLHLLGHDHETSPREERIMTALEKRLIRAMGQGKRQ